MNDTIDSTQITRPKRPCTLVQVTTKIGRRNSGQITFLIFISNETIIWSKNTLCNFLALHVNRKFKNGIGMYVMKNERIG